jgi:MFS family permease
MSQQSITGGVGEFVGDYVARTREFSRNANLYVLHVIGMDMIHGSWTVLFNLYLLAIGFDIRFIGLRLVVEFIARAVTAVPAGLTSDRIGRKASFILGDGMGAIFGLAMISTRSEFALLALPALGAFFGNLHHTAEPAFMAENSRPKERVHLFAVAGSLRTTSAMIGALVAGLMPALFTDAVGQVEAYRFAVYAGLALWFLSLIPALMLRAYEAEERPEEQFAREPRERRGLRGLFAGVRHPRRIFFFVLTSGLVSLGFGVVGPLFNIVFHDGHVHAGEAQLGFIFAAGELALALATLLTPLLVIRLLRVDAILVTRLTSVPFVVGMGVWPLIVGEGQVLTLLVAFSYVGRISAFRMSSPLDDAFNMDVLDARERATNTGIEIAVGGAISAGAIFLGSRMLDGGDFMTPFLIMAAAYLLSTLIYWRVFRPLDEEISLASEAELQPVAVAGGGGDA